jgi:adenylosuccinate synthase
MRARAVIGASFGDEGKGLTVDYLCATQGAEMVVRFNGGSQAGHTVVTPDGARHVFSHFGSGTLAGVPTFLSQFFICNPVFYFRELKEMHEKGITPTTLYAHPNCLVTTFADMMINQRLEEQRGKARHGSVGLGVSETVERSFVPELKITMADLWNGIPLASRIEQICGKYATFRTGKKIDEPSMAEHYLKACERFAASVHPLGIGQCKNPVFEGAQGLLLDQNNKEYFPHVTRSNTGMKNVRTLCEQAGIKDIDTYYVSRTYLTKHGAGPMPGENPRMHFEDNTNTEHPWQGALRFAPLNMDSLHHRCAADHGGSSYKLILTHCDQLAPISVADLYSYGPTRSDIRASTDNRKSACARA